jgi:hypothetical protein
MPDGRKKDLVGIGDGDLSTADLDHNLFRHQRDGSAVTESPAYA